MLPCREDVDVRELHHAIDAIKRAADLKAQCRPGDLRRVRDGSKE
jgi:hypothetical protein